MQQPTPLLGTEGLTWRTEAQLARFSLRAMADQRAFMALVALIAASGGVAASMAAPPGPAWAIGAAAAAAVTVLLGFVLIGVVGLRLSILVRRRRGWIVGYFTKDATQLVYPDGRGAWALSDHVGRRRGLAKSFRRRVSAHIAAQADLHQVPIVTDTHSERLALLYVNEIPGTRIVGVRRTLFGRLWFLRRDPAGPPEV